MLQMSEYHKLYGFMHDLNYATMDNWGNTHFRRCCLRLIRQYFDIQIASFLMYETPISLEDKIKTPKLDNVTIGLSDDILHAYYQKYFYEDPLKNMPVQDKVVRLSDRICREEFLQTDYYKMFYKKYGMKYQIGASIMSHGGIIGSLSFIRKESDGDFTDNEIELFRHICDIVTPGLTQTLHYETLQLENFALRNQLSIFPVAQIVLDKQSNVIYYNDQAEIYCPELTGGLPEQFTHYFTNHIQPYLKLNGKPNEFMMEKGAFNLKVHIQTYKLNATNTKEHYRIVVYFSKNHQQESQPVIESNSNGLTGREKEIVSLLRHGLSNKEMAQTLFISPYTVKSHLQNIYRKNSVHSKTELLYLLSKS